MLRDQVQQITEDLNQEEAFSLIRQRNKMRVKTKISKKDIQFVEMLSENTHEQFKYACPICLRYFNTILVGSCCKNYICRLCIGEMAKAAKKDPKYIIRCAYCAEDDFKLYDVD